MQTMNISLPDPDQKHNPKKLSNLSNKHCWMP